MHLKFNVHMHGLIEKVTLYDFILLKFLQVSR
jgi:hypothetical protein